MMFPFRCLLAPSALLMLTSGLLASCSSPSPTNPPAISAATTAAASAPASPSRAKVDSLNGIAGHHFGELLSAFPGLVPVGQKELGAQSYYYSKNEPGWFGKRCKEYPNEFYTRYTFAEGKFVAFFASGKGDMRPALQKEAEYLYGPGVATLNGSLWSGQQAEAWTAPDNQGFAPATTLLVRSQAIARQQAAQANARLKAENAQ